MTNIFEVLEIICLLFNISSLIVIGIGWLTCADYYYTCAKFWDGFALFMHSLASTSISIASIFIGLTIGSFGEEPYVNLGYYCVIVLSTVLYVAANKIVDIRQYFANKRGRRV